MRNKVQADPATGGAELKLKERPTRTEVAADSGSSEVGVRDVLGGFLGTKVGQDGSRYAPQDDFGAAGVKAGVHAQHEENRDATATLDGAMANHLALPGQFATASGDTLPLEQRNKEGNKEEQGPLGASAAPAPAEISDIDQRLNELQVRPCCRAYLLQYPPCEDVGMAVAVSLPPLIFNLLF